MKNVNLFICLLLLLTIGCNAKTEKFQKHRDKIINVGDKIIDIKPEILFGESVLYIIDDILIVMEISPKVGEKGIHLFNKNTFKYITSTGVIGRGPGEITSPGAIGINRKNRVFWVPDYGKRIMWKFPLDSVLNNKMYKPTIKLELHNESSIFRFGFLNDSIVLGKAVQERPNHVHIMAMSKLNLKSNVIEEYGYEHPKTVGDNSLSLFSLSVENNFYVNCYYYNDLMTICDLNGNLRYNVYGPDGLNNKDNKKAYFFDVDILGKNIIASYIGDIGLISDVNGPRGNAPSKFIVFDTDGNYKETIETGYKFDRFCVDEENKRVIVYFEGRAEALGYFNVNYDSL